MNKPIIKLLSLDNAKYGELLVKNGGEVKVAHIDNWKNIVGVAARDIEKGDVITYIPGESTEDIIVSTAA